MSWRSTRSPSGAPRRPDSVTIRCPHCRARFHRSGDRIPMYSVFSCQSCGSRLMRQQSLVVALGAPPEEAPEAIERAV